MVVREITIVKKSRNDKIQDKPISFPPLQNLHLSLMENKKKLKKGLPIVQIAKAPLIPEKLTVENYTDEMVSGKVPINIKSKDKSTKDRSIKNVDSTDKSKESTDKSKESTDKSKESTDKSKESTDKSKDVESKDKISKKFKKDKETDSEDSKKSKKKDKKIDSDQSKDKVLKKSKKEKKSKDDEDKVDAEDKEDDEDKVDIEDDEDLHDDSIVHIQEDDLEDKSDNTEMEDLKEDEEVSKEEEVTTQNEENKQNPEVKNEEEDEYASLTPEERDAKEKEEYIWRFKIMKKKYRDKDIPEYNEHDDLETMKITYGRKLKEISLDENVDSYRTYLILGFHAIEYGATNWLGIDLKGFTAQQMNSMDKYDTLLIELGEKSQTRWFSSLPVEIRLIGFILLQAGLFYLGKVIAGSVGDGISDFFKTLTGQNKGGAVQTGAGSATAPGPEPRKKMRGPTVKVDDLKKNV